MKFRFIEMYQEQFPVARMCGLLEVLGSLRDVLDGGAGKAHPVRDRIDATGQGVHGV